MNGRNGEPPVKARAEEAVVYLWLGPDGEPTDPRKRAATEEGSADEAVAYLLDANGEPKDMTTKKRALADEGLADEAVTSVWDADRESTDKEVRRKAAAEEEAQDEAVVW
jgi:hypothetical protein